MTVSGPSNAARTGQYGPRAAAISSNEHKNSSNEHKNSSREPKNSLKIR